MPPISRLVEFATRSPDSPSKHNPLSSSSFSLDASGFAGFFGGESAVTAVATVQLYSNRRWGGWYNTPGAYEIALKYGQLPNSRFWDALFPGPKCEPEELFGLNGLAGPSYVAMQSGSRFPETGYPAYLVARKAKDVPVTDEVNGRTTRCEHVTVVDLARAPQDRLDRLTDPWAFLCLLPIAASFAACAMCAYIRDWWCFASIALGIVASGITCAVIGSGELAFTHPTPASGAPRGDGILKDDKNSNIIVLRGEEGAVNALTRGRFSLKYGARQKHSRIGHCAILLTIQFLAQLLLIPQGTLLGQLLFVASLGISWLYNIYLSSLEREELQIELLGGIMGLDFSNVKKFTVPNHTAAAFFTCLALRDRACSEEEYRKLLNELIPNDTPVWMKWKELATRKLMSSESEEFTLHPMDSSHAERLDPEQRGLLDQLLADAQKAYEEWKRVLPGLPPSNPGTHHSQDSAKPEAMSLIRWLKYAQEAFVGWMGRL